jgi:uncharacterized membrane protein (DUF485 family)
LLARLDGRSRASRPDAAAEGVAAEPVTEGEEIRVPDRTTDWEAVEATDDFRELVTSRSRFVFTVGGGAMALGLLFVVLSGVAPDLLGTEVVGSMSLGFLGGVAMIVVTWVVTFLYMRRSDSAWAPLEEKVAASVRTAPAPASAEREEAVR